jgi:2-haloacid dehalogenase
VLDELEIAARDATLIAAHAWDVRGARAAGLDAIWIDRLERRWPLPVAESSRAASLAHAVEMVLSQR